MTRRTALVVLALGASALTIPAALATPATTCTVPFSGHGQSYALDACTGVLTFAAHTGDQWVIVTGPSGSGSAFGPAYLPQAGGTMAVTVTGCGGQVDIRSTKKRTGPEAHIAGRQFSVPNCGTPTPTETSSTPTSPSPTSHPSPSGSSSRPTTPKSRPGQPSSSSSTAQPLTSGTPTTQRRTLAATGSDLLPPTLAGLGLIVAGVALTLRRKGTHR